MLLIKKSHMYQIIFIYCLIISFLGFTFYKILIHSNIQHDPNIKYLAENFIYYSIVLIIIIILIFLKIIFKSKNILKELDKIIQISKQGNYNISDYIKKLDVFGEKISYILTQSINLSNMKSLKINSLSKINNFLIENNKGIIILIDSFGNIINCSKQFFNKFKTSKDLILNKHIKEFIKNLDFENLSIELEKTHDIIVKKDLTVEIEKKKTTLNFIFFPFYNIQNQMSHILLTINKTAPALEETALLADVPRKILEKKEKQNKNILNFLKNIFKKLN